MSIEGKAIAQAMPNSTIRGKPVFTTKNIKMRIREKYKAKGCDDLRQLLGVYFNIAFWAKIVSLFLKMAAGSSGDALRTQVLAAVRTVPPGGLRRMSVASSRHIG
jgi:hypothetical protein